MSTRRSVVFPQEFSGSNLSQFDQGVHVNDINTMYSPASAKLKPINDFYKLKNGRPVNITVGSFDDTESPINLGGSTYTDSLGVVRVESAQISLALFDPYAENYAALKKTGITVAPSHELLDNDFGQPDTFQDGTSYLDKNTNIDPLWIIEQDPFVLPYYLSEEMMNSTEMISLDGVIDQFSVRKEADRSFIEVPFRYRGIRGDLVNDNVYRRSFLTVDEVPTVISRLKIDNFGIGPLYSTDPFLDAGDEFGLEDLAGSLEIGPINSEGYVLPEESRTSPYKESDDSELTAGLLRSQSDSVMKSIVISLSGSNRYPTHDQLSRDHISPRHGFVYDNNTVGIDSLAFGGLLR